jgi:hypothetical protein
MRESRLLAAMVQLFRGLVRFDSLRLRRALHSSTTHLPIEALAVQRVLEEETSAYRDN